MDLVKHFQIFWQFWPAWLHNRSSNPLPHSKMQTKCHYSTMLSLVYRCSLLCEIFKQVSGLWFSTNRKRGGGGESVHCSIPNTNPSLLKYGSFKTPGFISYSQLPLPKEKSFLMLCSCNVGCSVNLCFSTHASNGSCTSGLHVANHMIK